LSLNYRNVDVAVIGGGPGGSTLAALLAKEGINAVILEKEKFPRFKIGESLLPYSMDILRKSGAFDIIDSGNFIRKYGAQFIDWRKEQEVYFDFQNSLDSDHPFSFEVQRSEFDSELLNHAKNLGTQVFQPEEVKNIIEKKDLIEIQTNMGRLNCRYLIDASGRNSVLGRLFKTRQRNKEFNNISMFSHFKNVKRSPGKNEGDIVVGILPDHCWSWLIPFKGEITSVGVVIDANKNKDAALSEDFIRQLFSAHPKLVHLMSGAKCIRPIQSVTNYSEKCTDFMGPRWLLLGDAAGFLDPVFSSGVHVALKSAELASLAVVEALKQDLPFNEVQAGISYPGELTKGIERFRSLLRLFYETDFVPAMEKVKKRPHTLQAFTAALGGDVWNEANPLFQSGVL